MCEYCKKEKRTYKKRKPYTPETIQKRATSRRNNPKNNANKKGNLPKCIFYNEKLNLYYSKILKNGKRYYLGSSKNLKDMIYLYNKAKESEE